MSIPELFSIILTLVLCNFVHWFEADEAGTKQVQNSHKTATKQPHGIQETSHPNLGQTNERNDTNWH